MKRKRVVLRDLRLIDLQHDYNFHLSLLCRRRRREREGGYEIEEEKGVQEGEESK